MNKKTWGGGVVILAAFVAGLAGQTGCQRYANYPAIPTSEGIAEDPNTTSATKCMSLAVAYVATRYSPGGYNFDAKTAKEQGDLRVPFPLVVNGPRGMRKGFYQRLAGQIGPEAQVISPANEAAGLPVYHVIRVWLRRNRATVDVLRPMNELAPDAQGRPVYQTVTVRLEGGLDPWRVIHARGTEPGLDPVPAAYYLPEVDRTDQYEYQQELDRKAAQPAALAPGADEAPTPEAAPVVETPADSPGASGG